MFVVATVLALLLGPPSPPFPPNIVYRYELSDPLAADISKRLLAEKNAPHRSERTKRRRQVVGRAADTKPHMTLILTPTPCSLY